MTYREQSGFHNLYSRVIKHAILFFQELSLLPLMEPCITANLELFTPFGSSTGNDETKLKGSFGNAVLDNIPDYYSQLLTQVKPSRTVYSVFVLFVFVSQVLMVPVSSESS